jgi:hypothetical protein
MTRVSTKRGGPPLFGDRHWHAHEWSSIRRFEAERARHHILSAQEETVFQQRTRRDIGCR